MEIELNYFFRGFYEIIKNFTRGVYEIINL
jgi:hypothetical protein